MNVTLEGSPTIAPLDLTIPRSKGIVIGFWIVTALFCAIRGLLERWAAAVQACDLDGVLCDHADDIVMFDVPPPERGVRGVRAYRDSWPPFFRWLQQGGTFEIDTLEVTAGDDVAFAHALLRCRTRETLQKHPDKRLPYVAVDDVDGTGVVGADRLDSTCLLEVR